MKTIVVIASLLILVSACGANAHDDVVTSETYYAVEDYGTGLARPGSRTNPYVTEQTDRQGNTRTYETHESIPTLPNSTERNTLYPAGSRLNPYITERTK